jgi:type III pantothenate kinase
VKSQKRIENIWLGLEIGNSRLHWALFIHETLDLAWDTEHLPELVIQQIAQCHRLDDWPTAVFPSSQLNLGQREIVLETSTHPPMFIASVVPSQTALWQIYPNVEIITLDQVPLLGMYSTLGIDRALSLWGAGKILGFPILVIDAGTTLTFTGADINQCLVGGAILPGLGLQFSTVGQKTGQLPIIETKIITSLPPRFALTTPEAIQSGVIYTLIAGIKDFIEAWWDLFPKGKVAIKGGDRTLLLNYLQALYPEIATSLIVEPNLIFWGMREIVMGNK